MFERKQSIRNLMQLLKENEEMKKQKYEELLKLNKMIDNDNEIIGLLEEEHKLILTQLDLLSK